MRFATGSVKPAAAAAWGAVLAVLSAASAGCGPQWHFEYGQAETLARSQECPILLFYKNPLDARSSQMEDLMEGPRAAPLLKGKVLCLLVDEYPPNRKYVAQYGAIQPPALVLIHPDGTYHAYDGPPDLGRISDFFAKATPPGNRPQLNPQIPRVIDYRWEGVYEEAVEKAQRQNRDLLIVYKWWLSPESNELLNTLGTRPEVATHFTETVNCLLDTDYLPNRTHVRQYGITKVPALILVHRDGTYHAHTGPMTADQIVRWVTSANPPGQKPRAEFTERMEARADYRWYSDFNRALAHARNRGADLFVFYNSLYSDQSNRMALLLDRSDVAVLFQDTINCRLDFSEPANRQLMSRYRVDRAPAFLIIHPDGTYQTRVGVVTREDLISLLEAAGPPGQTPRRTPTAP